MLPAANQLLVARLRVALWILLTTTLLYAGLDLVFRRGESPAVHLVQLVQVAVVVAGFRMLRRAAERGDGATVGVFIGVAFALTNAATGVATGDLTTAPLLLMLLMLGGATLLPWGVEAQIIIALVTVGAAFLHAYLITGHWLAIGFAPLTALIAAGVVSIYIAREFQRYLIAVAERDLEHRQAEAQQREHAEVFAALAHVGQQLMGARSIPSLLDRACQLTAELLGADVSTSWLWQPESEAYAFIASHGIPAEQLEWLRVVKIPRDAVAPLLPLLERDDVLTLGAGTFPKVPLLNFGPQFGLDDTLCIALRRGDALIGWQAADYSGRPAPFSLREQRIARGLGQLVSLALENARLMNDLQHANRLKADFVATMSHELRTPLNVIIGYTDLLLEGAFETVAPAQVDVLRRVRAQSEQLRSLIEMTLDLSRLESERVVLDLRPVHVPDLLAELDVELHEMRNRPGVEVQWRIAPELPSLRTDPAKLKIVLRNLISNAIKFTPDGQVTTAVARVDDGVEFEVADSGIGIAPEMQSAIFEAFRQADSTIAQCYGGVGLGLYIVRRLLDLLGGRITLESEVGRGSTFRVWLPVTAPAIDRAATQSSSS